MRKDVWGRPWIVIAFFLAATIVWTWPLVTVLRQQIAGDLEDPLFNAWILRWTSGQVLEALHGDLAALVAQAQSCGYYMAYFTPFAVAYCLYEMAVRDKLRDSRTWRALLGAGGVALLATASFLWPYLQVRQFTGLGVRDPLTIQ